jgi:alpha-methylacyl-CoA racemase
MSGPLRDLKVLEFAGLGPTPYSCMMLADMGAQVLRIDRIDAGSSPVDMSRELLNRGRPSIALDLKSPDGIAFARELAATVDVLVEGFRPGVMERLGLGPAPLMADNPRLVYARMTGWGQEGPMSQQAGHDINYLALTGALHMMGPADRPPVPPINLVGDYGGGGMFLVTGILAALLERANSGRGQQVDAAMADGASLLLTQMFGWSRMGLWREEREGNLLDGAAYFYRCYETADGRYMAVGALEPQFHANLIRGLGLDPEAFANHLDRRHWAARAAELAAVFRTRSQADWVATFEGIDACVSPVLTMAEAVNYPANVARRAHETLAGIEQPAPAPRFSRTPASLSTPPVLPGVGGASRLAAWGVPGARLDMLRGAGLLRAS